MITITRYTLLLVLYTFLCSNSEAYNVVVSKDGVSDFQTITEALESIPANYSQRFEIFVKAGTYHEKLRVDRDFISIIGEDSAKCTIAFAQLTSEWNSNKDFTGPAVINVNADDFILKNISVKNTQPRLGKNAYVIYLTGTNTILDHCRFETVGSNTVSLMNKNGGSYFASNCHFEGAVDLFRAQGNCWVENCTFFQHEAIGTVWHSAIDNENEKLILKNCFFDGVDHFFLGRHHYDAQYYFIDCQFGEKMADKEVYRKTYKDASKDRPYFWGDRHYYYNCRKEGTQFNWYASNISEKQMLKRQISELYSSEWNPIVSPEIAIEKIEQKENSIFLYLSDRVTVKGDLQLEDEHGNLLNFYKGKGRNVLELK